MLIQLDPSDIFGTVCLRNDLSIHLQVNENNFCIVLYFFLLITLNKKQQN